MSSNGALLSSGSGFGKANDICTNRMTANHTSNQNIKNWISLLHQQMSFTGKLLCLVPQNQCELHLRVLRYTVSLVWINFKQI